MFVFLSDMLSPRLLMLILPAVARWQSYCTMPNLLLHGIAVETLQLSLIPVGVVQANWAGKSTLIKLLTGEMQPQEGAVWKHPNTRLAYVAQHAFHHLEKVRSQHLSPEHALSEHQLPVIIINRTICCSRS